MRHVVLALITLVIVLQFAISIDVSASSYKYSVTLERPPVIYDFFTASLYSIDDRGNLYMRAYTFPILFGLVPPNTQDQISIDTLIKVSPKKNIDWCRIVLNGTQLGSFSSGSLVGSKLVFSVMYPHIYLPSTASVAHTMPYVVIMDTNGNIIDVKIFHLSKDINWGGLTLWYSFSIMYKNGYYYFWGVKASTVIIGKANSNFDVLWVKKLYLPPAHAFYVDDQGNVYIGGEYSNKVSMDMDSGYIVKLDPSGNILWAKQIYIGSPSPGVTAITVYNNKVIFAMSGSALIIGKLNTDGSVIWVKKIKLENASVKQIWFDNKNGYILFTGETNDKKLFFAKFDTNLNYLGSTFFKDPAPSSIYLKSPYSLYILFSKIYLKSLYIVGNSTYIYGDIADKILPYVNFRALDILYPNDTEALKTEGSLTYTISEVNSIKSLSVSAVDEIGWFETSNLPIVSCVVKRSPSVSYKIELLNPKVSYEYGKISSISITSPTFYGKFLFDNTSHILLLGEQELAGIWKPVVAVFSTTWKLVKAYLIDVPSTSIIDAHLVNNNLYILLTINKNHIIKITKNPSRAGENPFFYIIKLSLQTGKSEMWRINMSLGAEYCTPLQVINDNDGSVYFTFYCGYIENRNERIIRSYIVRLDPDGNIYWIREFDGYGLATLLNSHLYIILEDFSTNRVYVIKMSSSGDVLSSRYLQIPNEQYLVIHNIVSDNKNVYALLDYYDYRSHTFKSILLSFDDKLSLLWAKNISYVDQIKVDEKRNMMIIVSNKIYIIGADGVVKKGYEYSNPILDATIINGVPVALGIDKTTLYSNPSPIKVTLPDWNGFVSVTPADFTAGIISPSVLNVKKLSVSTIDYTTNLANEITVSREILKKITGEGMIIKIISSNDMSIKINHPYSKQINETTYETTYSKLRVGKVIAILSNGTTITLGSILTHPKFVLYANTTIENVIEEDPYTIKITFSAPALVSIAASDGTIKSIIKDGTIICNSTVECASLRDSDGVIVFDPVEVIIVINPTPTKTGTVTGTETGSVFGGTASKIDPYSPLIILLVMSSAVITWIISQAQERSK